MDRHEGAPLLSEARNHMVEEPYKFLTAKTGF